MDDTKEIMIESKNGFVVVDEMQIVSIKTKERNTTVLLSSGRRIECIRPLKEWKEILNGKAFIETHRGVIVNLKYVCEVYDERILLLDGTEEEYLSRRKYREFKQAYMTYSSGKKKHQ